eukprot:1137554-Pelagomonas_calceolata.AAC.2
MGGKKRKIYACPLAACIKERMGGWMVPIIRQKPTGLSRMHCKLPVRSTGYSDAHRWEEQHHRNATWNPEIGSKNTRDTVTWRHSDTK